MAALVDTNILVYRFDPRTPLKQEQATELLKQGVMEQSLVLPYQALVEFVSVTTRPGAGRVSLLSQEEAHREADGLMAQFPVLYPTEITLRTALRGAALYQMSWFDSLIWACAEEAGLEEIWSEDFQEGRLYGRVRVRNPFQLSVHE